MRISSNDADEKQFDVNLAANGVTPLASTARSATAKPASFAASADLAGLVGDSSAADAIPHGDGICNLLKYAFNLELSRPDCRTLEPGTGTAGLPAVTTIREKGSTHLRIEYLRRTGTELEYTPKVSSDLVSWTKAQGESQVLAIDAEWERVIFLLPPSASPRFAVVEVSQIID